MIALTGAEIIAGAVFLCGCIGALLKIIHGNSEEIKKKVKEMETLHASQNEHVIDLTGKVNRLEGEREGFIGGVEKISSEVIAAVKELKEND